MLNQSLIGYSFRVDTGASQKVGERVFLTEDGVPGRFLPNARGRLGGGGLFSFYRLSGQEVRGMGWTTRLVRESYGRIKRPQLVI